MKKWKLLGYLAAVFSPIPVGVVAGYCLYTEKKYKKTGRNVLILSVVWGIVLIILANMISA
jgi:RsiW-degrading membrane proteinase PrsW (M82 family)